VRGETEGGRCGGGRRRERSEGEAEGERGVRGETEGGRGVRGEVGERGVRGEEGEEFGGGRRRERSGMGGGRRRERSEGRRQKEDERNGKGYSVCVGAAFLLCFPFVHSTVGHLSINL